LERGELKLSFDLSRGEFSVFYYNNRFPVDPAEYPRVLDLNKEQLQEKLGTTHADFLEMQSIITALSHLPGRRGLTPEQRAERIREKEVQKKRLATLCERSAEIAEFIRKNVTTFNGQANDPHSFDALHELIKMQVYRLAQWRVAADDINYRRFFDINDLAALCMENETVFTNTHRFTLELVSRGMVDGLRIDHPDGLYDPAGYFRRLRSSLSASSSGNDHVYVVAEKILTGNERLRSDWPIDGTTGYEFGSLVNGLFVDQSAADKIDRIYRAFRRRASEPSPEFSDLVYTCKKLILQVVLASELNVLANLLTRIALANRHTCDFTLNSLKSALAEIIACFPVYRTYVNGPVVSEEDRRYVERAVAAGKKRSNAADLSVFDFVRRVLLMEISGEEPGWYKRAIVRFAMKFQQATAAVMAKGVEDTAFYRYNRLVSLNEIGGNPNKFGVSVEEFHRANQERLNCWPDSMLSSSTHDSKRSEDVRARINVLSEIPAAWRLRLRRWRQWNRSKKRMLDDQHVPTRNDEYLLYQTLIGMWPAPTLDEADWRAFCERIEQYMLKAVREAKEHTSWANTNEEYEHALLSFTRAILERTARNQFLADFTEFQRFTAKIGLFNSLSQCLLKLTSPGVPDIYQGQEFLDFALVDPDNRRPVDYAARIAGLKQFEHDFQSRSISADRVKNLPALENGDAKLYLTWKALRFRANESDLFRRGNYLPLETHGEKARHIVAFSREYEGRTSIIAVPRLCASLLGQTSDSVCTEAVWGETTVELINPVASCYHNVFTGECMQPDGEQVRSLSAGILFRDFPVALLTSEPARCN
jgi:(1->4)-alpha-D-glucan 1-alpha-D-glucosylmutase